MAEFVRPAGSARAAPSSPAPAPASSPALDFAELFARSPNPYMVLDRSLRFVTANTAYLRLTGARLEELVGRPIFEAFPNDPGDPQNAPAAMLRESFQRVLATRLPDTIALIPYRVPRAGPDGGLVDEDRYWSATHTPILDATGAVSHILQHTVDVTELYRLSAGAFTNPEAVPSAQMQAGLLGRAQVVQDTNRLLDAERQQLLRLFEQAPGFVAFLRGPEHVFELANHAYMALIGREGILGKPIREALPDVEGQGFYELLDRVFITQKPFAGRGVKVQLAKGPAYVDFVYQPILGADGRTTGVLVQGVDITEQMQLELRREQAERALRASEERLRRVVEASGAGTWEVDPVNGVASGDAAMHALLGQPPGARLTLEALIDGIHPDDRARARSELERAIRSAKPGERFEFEFRTRARPGVPERWIETRSQGVFDLDGRVVRFVGTGLDVTERKRATQQWEQLRYAVEQSTDFIGIAGLDGYARYANEGALKMVGASAAEVPRLKVIEFFVPEERAFVADVVLPATLREGRWVGDLHFRHFQTGAKIPVRYDVFVLRDAQTQEPIGFATVTTDITERKKAEDDLRRRADFEQQLIGIVSHDLRNPLSAILIGASTLLRRDDVDPKTTKTAARIQSSVERAGRMVRDLLDFTQIRMGGGIPLKRSEVRLEELARAVVDELQMTYPHRELRLEGDRLGSGVWDADRLSQVISNLVTNAMKYSPDGTPVTVTTRGLPGSGGGEVEVHNLGAPIPPELQHRLFHPMQRGEHELSQQDRSVGLGLFIVKHLVEQHGGTIEMRSTAEDGTRFTVKLPRTS